MTQPLDYQIFKACTATVLRRIGAHKTEAVLAIEMIVGHESKGGRYWRQLGGGPARGVIQMESWVHDDTWAHCDNIRRYAARGDFTQDVDLLSTDLDYNIFMARMRLIMDVRPLPSTPEAMAHYLKDYWNSGQGKASAAKYLNDWQEWRNATT